MVGNSKEWQSNAYFSPKKNPDLEIKIDGDRDGSFDDYKYPDYLHFQ